MIIEILQHNKDNSRNRTCQIIDYLFDVDSTGYSANRKHRDEVKFAGASASLCCENPFYPFSEVDSESSERLDLRDIKHAFKSIESKNKRVKNPFLHIVVSLRPGEMLPQSKWYELVSDYVEAMGYSDNLWIAVTHDNTKSQHAHLLLSCIENSVPHRKTKDSNNFLQSAKIRDRLEKKYGLEQDNNPLVNDGGGVKVSDSHFKTKIQTVREKIDNVLERGNRKGIGLNVFINELAYKGIGCLVRLDEMEVAGVSYSIGVEHFAGSSLGVGYSWPELINRGVSCELQLQLGDILYANQREQSVSLLIENAYEDIDIQEEQVSLDHHYLIEQVNSELINTNNEFGFKKYRFFRLLNQVKGCVNHFKKKAEDKMIQLIELRRSLYFVYDSVYNFGVEKFDSIMKCTKSSKVNVQLLSDLNGNENNINYFVSQESNKKCLEDVGFVLVSSRRVHEGGWSKEYALRTAAKRQNSMSRGKEKSLLIDLNNSVNN